MANGIEVKLKSGGMAQLLKSNDVRSALTSRMERALAQAQSDAPVATGAYRDGLHIEQDTTDRAAVRLVGGSDHDFVVEANTGNLARALDAAGGA